MKKEKDKSSFLFEDLPFFNLLYSVVGLVCSAPVNHVLRRLAAAYADIRDFFLFKRNTSAGCCCSFLDGILTGLIAAPHCFNEAGCFVDDFFKFIHCFCNVGSGFTVFGCFFQHIFVNFIQKGTLVSSSSRETKIFSPVSRLARTH